MPFLGFVGRGKMLLGCHLVGYGDVSAVLGVDVIHHLPEERAVGRGVLHLVYGNIIMYHLMNDDILNIVFREVESLADFQFEVI